VPNPKGYTRELNPEQQVDTWLKVMDREEIDTAVCFPTSCGKLAYLQETSFAAAVARACNNHLAKEFGGRSKRMKMVGVLPIQDPLEATKESAGLYRVGARELRHSSIRFPNSFK
jgi:hypothetical protein